MFVRLTSADDGQPIHVRASAVMTIEAMSAKATRIGLAGGGEAMVRERGDIIRDLVLLEEGRSSGAVLPRPPELRSP